MSFCECQCGHDFELCQGAGGGDSGPAQSRKVVAIGMGDAFDQAKESQATQLTRERKIAEFSHVALQIGAAHATDVEFGTLQCPQQLLLGAPLAVID